MNTLTSLLEGADSIPPASPCSLVQDRFLDAPGCDLLAIVESGKALGVIARGSIRIEDMARPVREIMTPAFVVECDMGVDDSKALLLGHRDPLPGVVVTEGGVYRGVVSARTLIAARGEGSADVRQLRFLELISREMRTPLNGVLAVSELLQRQPLSIDSQAYVRTITESAQATLRALNDALELSQGDFKPLDMDPKPVVLRDLMDAVQSQWQGASPKGGVTLLVAYDGEPNLTARFDPARVQQVFDRLIEAALTLNRRGAVEAILQATRVGENLRLTARVRDTGGGLASERLLSAFEGDFSTQRIDPANAGLGIAICRRVVDQMQGHIRAERNVGAGASVVFELTVPEVVEAVVDGNAGASVGRAAHVLVVDDNATNRMVAEALCEMFDCSSESAEDGLQAVEAARTGRFDLILMDIRMPRMDGVEATRAIRALPGRAGSVPIIALTANADPEDAKTYLATGMHNVVEKPIKPEKLLAAMSAALEDAPVGESSGASAAA